LKKDKNSQGSKHALDKCFFNTNKNKQEREREKKKKKDAG
jgi:hypothetical protein